MTSEIDAYSMFDGPSEDLTIEKSGRLVSLAQAAVEPLWPYVSGAQTKTGFEVRLEVVKPNLLSALANAGINVETNPGLDPDQIVLVATKGWGERYDQESADRLAVHLGEAADSDVTVGQVWHAMKAEMPSSDWDDADASYFANKCWRAFKSSGETNLSSFVKKWVGNDSNFTMGSKQAEVGKGGPVVDSIKEFQEEGHKVCAVCGKSKNPLGGPNDHQGGPTDHKFVEKKTGSKQAAFPRPKEDLSKGWARKGEDGSPEYWGSYQHGDTGQVIHMYRGKHNHVRFYDGESGEQVGPEQPNVAPGAAWALSSGYHDPDLAGLASKTAAKDNGTVYDSAVDLPKPGDKVEGRGGMIGDDDIRDVTVVAVEGPYGPFSNSAPGGGPAYHWDVKVDAGDGTMPYSQTWFTKTSVKTAGPGSMVTWYKNKHMGAEVGIVDGVLKADVVYVPLASNRTSGLEIYKVAPPGSVDGRDGTTMAGPEHWTEVGRYPLGQSPQEQEKNKPDWMKHEDYERFMTSSLQAVQVPYLGRMIAVRKGAPFAGYDDFEACVKANSDKDSPSAYCGYIKHKVEDSKDAHLSQLSTDLRVGSGETRTQTDLVFGVQGTLSSREVDTRGVSAAQGSSHSSPEADARDSRGVREAHLLEIEVGGDPNPGRIVLAVWDDGSSGVVGQSHLGSSNYERHQEGSGVVPSSYQGGDRGVRSSVHELPETLGVREGSNLSSNVTRVRLSARDKAVADQFLSGKIKHQVEDNKTGAKTGSRVVDQPTPARWNNTGGDMRVHLVPPGTTVLQQGEDPWSQPFQVTTPLCGLGIYHGGWTEIQEMRPPYRPCPACFGGERTSAQVGTDPEYLRVDEDGTEIGRATVSSLDRLLAFNSTDTNPWGGGEGAGSQHGPRSTYHPTDTTGWTHKHLQNQNQPGYGQGSFDHEQQGAEEMDPRNHRAQSAVQLMASATEQEWLEAEGAFFEHQDKPAHTTYDTDAAEERETESGIRRSHDEYYAQHPDEHPQSSHNLGGGYYHSPEEDNLHRQQQRHHVPFISGRHQADDEGGSAAYNWGYAKGQEAREGNPDPLLPIDQGPWSNEGGLGGPIDWENSDGAFPRGFRDGLAGRPKQAARHEGVGQYGGGEVPDDLAQAAAKHWFGERGQYAHEQTYQSRVAPDGGSYRIKGTRIWGGGEHAIIYVNTNPTPWSPEPYMAEFYDGSGGGITPNPEGGWTYTGMGGPSHFASRRQAARHTSGYGLKAFDIVGYTADADTYCPECTHRIYGDDNLGANPVYDGEGNEVHPIFASDEYEGEVCASCGAALGDSPLYMASRQAGHRLAVNEDAEGAARYQTPPSPTKPDWIVDEWGPEGRNPKSWNDAAFAPGKDKPMPFNNLQTTKDTRHKAVREAALRMVADTQPTEKSPYLDPDSDPPDGGPGPDVMGPGAPTDAGGSGMAGMDAATGQPIDDSQARTTKPRQSPADSNPDLVTVETEIMPGQMGGGGGFDMGYASDPGFGGYGADAGSTTMTAPEVADPMQPSVDQMVAAKVNRLAARVRQDNPDLSNQQARHIAAQTVATYPEMVQVQR